MSQLFQTFEELQISLGAKSESLFSSSTNMINKANVFADNANFFNKIPTHVILLLISMLWFFAAYFMLLVTSLALYSYLRHFHVYSILPPPTGPPLGLQI